jgi:UDP-2-acetamido-2-deoxy-ribo-hexuluronate aminotransferase
MEFRDLKAQYAALKSQIDTEIAEVIASTSFISGKKVDILEGQLADFVGTKHCISCASGTDALLLPLMGWNVGPGDAVFVPDFTFFATAEVVSRLGATPVFVDINPNSFNMDPDCLMYAIEKTLAEKKLTPRVVMPVDLFGQPADYSRLEPIARKYNLLLLEDAAQGFGGLFSGKRSGSFGDAAGTSFFPAKPLGCYGDGGAIFTNDDNLAQYLRCIAIHGKGTDKYDNVLIGLNSRLDTIQAAILLPKLQALREYELEKINAAAAKYSSLLEGYVQVPCIAEGFYSSFAQYSILLKDESQRQKVQTALKSAGIPSNIYYVKPLHEQTAFADLACDKTLFPVSNNVCSRILSLPIHPYLDSETITFICGKLLAAL